MKSVRHVTLQSLPYHCCSIPVVTLPPLYSALLLNTLPSRNRTTLLHSKTNPYIAIPLHCFITLHVSFALRGSTLLCHYFTTANHYLTPQCFSLTIQLITSLSHRLAFSFLLYYNAKYRSIDI